MLSLMTVSVLCYLLLLMQSVEVECGVSRAFSRLPHSSTGINPPTPVLQESIVISGMNQEGVDPSTGLRDAFLCATQYGTAGSDLGTSQNDYGLITTYTSCIVGVVKGWYNGAGHAGMSALQQTYNCTDDFKTFTQVVGNIYGNNNGGYDQPVFTVSQTGGVHGNCITSISYWNNPSEVGAIIFQAFFWTEATPLMGTMSGTQLVLTPSFSPAQCLSYINYRGDANSNTYGLDFYWVPSSPWLSY